MAGRLAAPRGSAESRARLREPIIPRDVQVLLVVTLGVLAPFLAKPVHIDDPLFIWTARQIQAEPFDYYGFDVNWYGVDYPMHRIAKNPPLASYYLACVGAVLGFSDVALHFGFLLPNAALVLGVYALAKRLTEHPLWAAVIALATPVVLLSATSLMCDALMLALWCWALVVWMTATDADRTSLYFVSGLLMGLCVLTKYSGLCVLPLAVAYALVARPKSFRWMAGVLVVVAMVAAYSAHTHWLYGRSLLLDAMFYADEMHELHGQPVMDQ